jgi:Kef-type K+ transport system membrane component KefB
MQAVDAQLLAAIALMIVAAKLCADVLERAGLPAVLGELAAGIVIGNLHLAGWSGLDFIARDPQLALLAQLGVVLLLFEVGLECNVAQMAKVGGVAFVVAATGVVVDMALGTGIHALIAPDRPWQAHLFIGAVLSATSVGITARVLADLGKVDSPTGRVVLGAAVIDDVLGLIVLAVVSGMISGAGDGGGVDVAGVVRTIALAVGFLGAAIALGGPVSRRLYRAAGVLRTRGVLLAASLAFCFVLAYLAFEVGLAPIVGAFAAGMVLDEVVIAGPPGPRDGAAGDPPPREDRGLETQLAPLGQLLTPIFFVMTGAQVDLGAFGGAETLGLAAALTAAAVIGKQSCGLVAFGPGVHRPSVGIGMVPRGEVGLIFAATGAHLMLGGQAVVPPSTYAAIVIMVLFTSLVTPPMLAWSLRRAPVGPA